MSEPPIITPELLETVPGTPETIILKPEKLEVTIGNIEINVNRGGHGYVKVDGVNLPVNRASVRICVGKQPIVILSVVPRAHNHTGEANDQDR